MTATAPQPRPIRRERRIIERPRLIKLLDETDARRILLVAPAGYGKTTLARQWAKSLQGSVWLALTPRHRDVAWLVQDLARAVDEAFRSDASRGIREHVRARSNPQRAPRELGEAISQYLTSARVQWLVLDDYHELSDSPEAEELLETVDKATRLRLLVCSRTRPRWSTGRRAVYGEVAEVGRDQLAMTDDETAQVLSRRRGIAWIADQAAGWPAVIGLAAAVNPSEIPRDALPEALHRYLAEELFHQTPERLQDHLLTLALLGDLSRRALSARFGSEAETIVSEARMLGFSSGDQEFELHPLLREFLLEKLLHDPESGQRIRRAIDANIAAESWDRALELVLRFRLMDSVEPILQQAFKPLARTGRLGTLSSFATAIATAPTFPPPSSEVVIAEVALRDGNLELARDLAQRVQPSLGPNHPLASRTAGIIGQVSFLLAEFDAAEASYALARDEAQEVGDETEALHGLAQASIFGERDSAAESLAPLAHRRHRSPTDFLRFITSEIAYRRLCGHSDGLNVSLRLDAARRTLPRVEDPLVRSALTYAAAGALTQRADYEAAADWIELLLEDVKKFNLEFAIPYAMWTAGQVALGQRRFGDTERALQIVEDAASRLQNRHHRLNANALRARLLLQNGDADGAAASIHEEPSFPLIPSWRGEYFATRALVKACAGDRTAALGDADRAKAATVAVEVSVLAQVARAIATFTDSFDEAHELIRMALASNIWDPVVCGVRASPALADALTGAKETRPAMEDLYQRTHDLALARRAGIRTRATSSPRDLLSPREFEVLGLIARGYRNRDISRALYIADSTTKVHMRHIFEKLGVRTRSEAVARFQMFS